MKLACYRNLRKEGYELVYTGHGDNKHRHYPHGFVTRVRGGKVVIEDHRRTDTVKCIQECFDVWEYVPIKPRG
jgi:hypothetical protein